MFKGAAAAGKILVRLGPALVWCACGGDDPQVPTTLAPPTVAALSGIAGAPLATTPSVTLTDQKGRGIANVWVKWTPTAGKVVNDSSRTDANGLASSGIWTLGPAAGTQLLSAHAAGLPVVAISAVAKAGPVAALDLITSAITGMVASDVAVPPGVRAVDRFGNPVEGAAVVFAVSSGAGSITGAQQTTNTSGIATVGSWKLGTLAGAQTLRADVVATGASNTLTATALSAAPVDFVIIDGNAQIGQADKRLCRSPVIAVRDQYGNGVGQIPIVFTPANGSGTVTTGSVLSRANSGYAAVGAWNLSGAATQTLVATSAALPGKSLTFTASVGPEPKFGICARFIGDAATPRQREAVAKAVARWQQVIVGRAHTVPLSNFNGDQFCLRGIGVLDEIVEDLLLFVEFAAIDGAGKIIGQAGPCGLSTLSRLPVLGALQLDVADVAVMEAQGKLENVVLHEIGHILGIGTLWSSKNLTLGRGTDSTHFLGAAARVEFPGIRSSFAGTPVPLENCVGITGCGDGTRDAHWRKSVFGNELMQGYVEQVMPVSRVTIGSLADIGYTVNLEVADQFPSFGASLRAGGATTTGTVLMNDVFDRLLWTIDGNGAVRTLSQPSNPLLRR
ncbi:MAG: hypothetical protein H7Z40_05330 [Phycisphaerae bacterium]|nr:hypothetical protein [Gemmatimonadaceae bacterium]